MPRKVYKKRSYKKRPAKARRYKRTYRRRYYKRSAIKKPEIHIVEKSTIYYPDGQGGTTPPPFNNSTSGVGKFINLTEISSNSDADIDKVLFNINSKSIEGKKIRLKYLYIKGYIQVKSTDDADNFNCKLMVFRWKRNITNKAISWSELLNATNQLNSFNMDDPSTWTETDRLNMLYRQDWKNDIKINFYKRIKNLYRKYDDANNIIPFRIRVPLYDCVLSCDTTYDSSTSKFSAFPNPSTNGLYFTFLSNRFDTNTFISYKYKLYYTDY